MTVIHVVCRECLFEITEHDKDVAEQRRDEHVNGSGHRVALEVVA